MSKKNQLAFEKFDDFLSLRRSEISADDEFDIRQAILADRHRPWNVGLLAVNLETSYASNLPLLFSALRPVDRPEFEATTKNLLPGSIVRDPKKSHIAGVELLQKFHLGSELVLAEQGFLASTHSWSEAFRQKNSGFGCLGYVYDDVAHYFMADYPNRLIHRLNSKRSLTAGETERARMLIEQIVQKKISKYNSQPIFKPTMTEDYSRRVLVCDQSFADASTTFGKIDEAGFERMLLAAIQENPNAEIIIKTHPDTFWEPKKRTGYYNHLVDYGRIRILRQPLNPYCLFDCVDKVYVGTSQLGLEALFAGKEVVCFGAPFYAGWGLTDDRQPIPHRHRERTLEEIFHYFYIWYTIYHVPGAVIPSEIEQVISHIENYRPVAVPPLPEELSSTPLVSVILPVYNVEAYVAQSIQSIQNQTLRDIEIITVNDRSPDGSQTIIDQLAAGDPRIKCIVLRQNVGQGLARNEALQLARGRYVFFLDSDDLLATRFVLEEAVRVASENDEIDLVRVQKLIFDDGTPPESAYLDAAEHAFERRQILPNCAEDPSILASWHFWNFLYRRDMLQRESLRFETPQWEERAFVCKAMLLSRKIAILPIPGVAYRKRAESTVRRERTPTDLLQMAKNIEATGRCLASTISRPIAALQFALALTRGKWATLLGHLFQLEGPTSELSALALALDAFRFRMDDLDTMSTAVNIPQLASGRPQLFLAALVARRWDLAEKALLEGALAQEVLYRELLVSPSTDLDTSLQAALSLYARNDRVEASPSAIAYTGSYPRIVIHTGTTKTGSTSIQYFFERNRPALLRKGIWYPEVGLYWQADRPQKQAGHSLFEGQAIRNESALREYIVAGLQLLEGKIHTIVLSSEAFFLNRRSSTLVSYFAGFEIEIVSYFRRQDDWANSQYAEFVAGGAEGRVSVGVEQWLADPKTRERLNYYSFLETWAEKIPRDRIHARVYERSKFPKGDIVEDFLHTIRLTEISNYPRPPRAQSNASSLRREHIEVIRHFNSFPWPDRSSYFRFIDEANLEISRIGEGSKGTPTGLDLIESKVRRRILEQAAESNSMLGIHYLHLTASPFDDHVPEHQPQAENRLSGEELDALFGAFERHSQKNIPPAAVESVEPPQTAEGPQNEMIVRTAVSSVVNRAEPSRDEHVRSSPTFRLVSAVCRVFLSKKKRKKLQNSPAQFFRDMKGPLGSIFGRLVDRKDND